MTLVAHCHGAKLLEAGAVRKRRGDRTVQPITSRATGAKYFSFFCQIVNYLLHLHQKVCLLRTFFKRMLNIEVSFSFMYSSKTLAASENGEPPSSSQKFSKVFCPWEGYGTNLPVLLRLLESFSLITTLSPHAERALPV